MKQKFLTSILAVGKVFMCISRQKQRREADGNKFSNSFIKPASVQSKT